MENYIKPFVVEMQKSKDKLARFPLDFFFLLYLSTFQQADVSRVVNCLTSVCVRVRYFIV